MTLAADTGRGRQTSASLILVFLAVMLAISSFGIAPHAASQTPQAATPDATPSDAVATPMATPIASPVAGQTSPDSFASYGYDDVTARGMYGSASYTFPLPLASSALSGGTLDILFSHSPLLLGDLSTMTVLINGESVDSVHLTGDTAEGGQLSVEIPAGEDEDATSLSITLAFHLRLTREVCEVPDDPAMWVTIHKESVVTLEAGDANRELYLADVPSLLSRSATDTEVGPVIVVPDDASDEVMQAAGVVTYQTGQWSGQSGNPALVSDVVAEMPEEESAAILVGTGSALEISGDWGGLAWDGEQYTLDGEAIPTGHGVLAIRQQPVPQLLVSGADPGAVRMAAGALSRPMDWPVFNAPVVVITGDLPEVNPGRYAWGDQAASFAQLGAFRRDVTGPGEHFIEFPFERPAGWELQEGSTLRLDLNVSPAARSETSWVRVVVNGQDIGTQAIQADGNGVQTYEFDLPVERLNTDLDGQSVRDLFVQVRIFLDYPHEACESIDPQATWAALLPTSAWLLPHGEYEGMDLGRFPAELVSVDDPTGLTIVLPDQPTPEERLAAFRTIAAVGRWNAWSEPVTPRLVHAGDVSEEDMGDRSVIVIGGPDRNAAANEFDEDVLDTIQPVARLSTDAPYGLLALGTSPWSDDDAALVVAGSGPDGEGTLLAATALGDEAALSGMQGTRVAVTGSLGAQVVPGADPANVAPSDLAPRILPDERAWIERLEAWQVVGGIVLVAFLALVIGVVQLRWIRGGSR